MNIRKAMIIGSIGLTSIIGCNQKNPTTSLNKPTQEQNYSLRIPTNLYKSAKIEMVTTDIDGDGDQDLILAIHDGQDGPNKGDVFVYTFKNDGQGNYK